MLKLRNLVENDNFVSELLNNYEFTKVQYGFCRSSSNVVYWVNGDGKLYFLRYTTNDERTKGEIEEELEYILFLRMNNIDANQPVKTKFGTYLIQNENYYAVLFEGVPGKSLEDIELNGEIVTKWGSQLGKLHKLSIDCSENTRSNRDKRSDHNEKFAWIRSILEKENDIELLKEMDRLENYFNQKIKTKCNYGLCHYDFELDNVFYDDKTKLFSIIDFDDSMYHFFSIDYAQVVMSIEEKLPIDMHSWVKEKFQKGYLEYNKIPEEEELRFSYEFIVLLGYVELTYSLQYPPEQIPDWMEELIKKFTKVKKEKRDWLVEQISNPKK